MIRNKNHDILDFKFSFFEDEMLNQVQHDDELLNFKKVPSLEGRWLIKR